MHPSVMDYVSGVLAGCDTSKWIVLEVGSYNENGSVRPLFPGATYVGVDVREGPGVDRVVGETELPFVNHWFDTVVSTEVLEHALHPWQTVAEIRRVLHPGGKAILTARGYDGRGCYQIHDYRDCWRFTVPGMAAMLEWAGFEQIEVVEDPAEPGVFATAVKP